MITRINRAAILLITYTAATPISDSCSQRTAM
jgi:hypothetical protein